MQHKPFGSYEKFFKRPLDFICGMLAIIAFCWLYLILIILGAIFMHGNPFFTQDRAGKDGRVFKLIKFRSMDNSKDKEGKLLPDADRLNKYGKFLRRTSLDEIPEAFNIVIGDMSVIGPRPLLPEYLPYYSERESHRHDVCPGMTGLAQINGRNSLSWEDIFNLDLEYVEHITFVGDLKILLVTVIKVFKRSDIAVAKSDMSGRLNVARKGEKVNEK